MFLMADLWGGYMAECGSRHIPTRRGEVEGFFFSRGILDTQGNLWIELERFSRGLSRNVVFRLSASESPGTLFTKADCWIIQVQLKQSLGVGPWSLSAKRHTWWHWSLRITEQMDPGISAWRSMTTWDCCRVERRIGIIPAIGFSMNQVEKGVTKWWAHTLRNVQLRP